MKKLLSISVVLLVVMFGWSAPAFTEPPPAPRGELRIVDKRPKSRLVAQELYVEHLTGVNHDGTVVPHLASGWHWLDDCTLEMTLRRGVRFHNGEVFDAGIVKLNWDFRMELTKYFNSHSNLFPSFPSTSRLEILDPYTIQFVLPGPNAEFLINLGVMRIVNRQFYQTLHTQVVEKNRPRVRLFFPTLRSPGPWGTGPYKLVKGGVGGTYQTDQVVFEANRAYWNKERFPKIQRLVFDNSLSTDDAVESIKTVEGQVDLFVFPRPLDTLRVAQSPFAKVVKDRRTFETIYGVFNRRKAESPWQDVRLRQAVNYAINRADFIRYAAKGNGVITPAVLPPGAFGFDTTLTPYPFAPNKARLLLCEAGYPNGLAIRIVAPEHLDVQATVVSKMLEQVGFTVQMQLLERRAYTESVDLLFFLSPNAKLQQRPWSTWDIALSDSGVQAKYATFPSSLYRDLAAGGRRDWIGKPTELQRLYTQLIGTIDREQQEQLFHRMERDAQDQAAVLFLYAPIQLYAVNKEVNFVPYRLDTTSVTDQHWSVRTETVAGQK